MKGREVVGWRGVWRGAVFGHCALWRKEMKVTKRRHYKGRGRSYSERGCIALVWCVHGCMLHAWLHGQAE